MRISKLYDRPDFKPRLLYALAIDNRAVGAAKIMDIILTVMLHQLRMMARQSASDTAAVSQLARNVVQSGRMTSSNRNSFQLTQP